MCHYGWHAEYLRRFAYIRRPDLWNTRPYGLRHRDDDDFFGSLQNELEGALEESSSDDGVEDVLGEDFFSGLIDEIADEVEASQLDTPAPSKQKSASDEINLAKLTVPVLKDMLRDKGLKVGGKKSELIERLQQS